MKKIICICAAAAAVLFCFSGCGDENKSSNASSQISSAVSDAASNAEEMISNGTVSDDDGIIGNESIGEAYTSAESELM